MGEGDYFIESIENIKIYNKNKGILLKKFDRNLLKTEELL